MVRYLQLLLLALVLPVFIYAQEPRLVLPVEHTQTICSFKISNNEKYVATIDHDGQSKLWELKSGKLINNFESHYIRNCFIKFSKDDKFIITSGSENTVEIWDVVSGELINKLSGHRSEILSAEYSNNGKFIVTASADGTSIIWDAISGKISHILSAHKGRCNSAEFSFDSKSIVTSGEDGTIKLWNVKNAKCIKSFKGRDFQGEAINSKFNLNTSFLFTSFIDGSTTLFNLKNNLSKRFYGLSNDKDGWANALNYNAFSPNGFCFATIQNDSSIQLYDLNSMKISKNIEFIEKKLFSFNYYSPKLIFTPDSKYIFSIETNNIEMFDVENGKLICKYFNTDKEFNSSLNNVEVSSNGNYTVVSSISGKLFVRDIKKNKIVSILNMPLGENINSAKFSSVNNNLIIQKLNYLKVIDKNNCTEIGKLEGHYGFINSYKINSDGNYLVSASDDGNCKIWDLANFKEFKNLSRQHDEDNYFYLETELRNLKNYITNPFKFSKELNNDKITYRHINLKRVNNAEISPSNKFVVTANADNTIRLWNFESGKEICRIGDEKVFSNSSEYNAISQFTPNEEYLLIQSNEYFKKLEYTFKTDSLHTHSFFSNSYSILIFDIKNEIVKNKIDNINIDNNRKVQWVSNDSKYLMYLNDSGYISVLEINSGNKIFYYKTNYLTSAIFNPDCKYISIIEGENLLYWDIANNRKAYNLRDSSKITNVIFSKDGKYLITANIDGTVKIINSENGQIIHVKNQKYKSINSIDVSFKDNLLLIAYMDKKISLLNLSSGKEYYQLVFINNDEYLAFDSLGHYDGTPAARKLLYYVCGNEIIDLDQIKELSWEPGLVSKIMGINKEPITAKGVKEINICNQVPEVEDLGLEKDIYRFKITSHEGGIGEIQLYINNHLRINFQKQDLKKEGENFILEINKNDIEKFFIPGSENYISAKATVSNGKMVSKGPEIVESGKEKTKPNPNMYILSIGVSQYKGEKIRLNYAANDAINFSSALTDASSKLLETDGKKHVYTFNCTTSSTNPDYWPTKSSIQNILKTISDSSKAEDIVVIFYSGHGSVKQGDNNFYFLTSEATSFDDLISKPDEVAISSKELNKWLQKISADKVIMIIDACNSGQLVKELDKFVGGKKEVPADQQRALENLKDHSGTYILSACSSDKSAFETNLYSQGVLTYSLLSSIKLGEGLRDKKFIDVSKWFDVTSKTVEKISKEIGRRQDPQIYGNASIDVGMVDSVILDKIHLPKRGIVFNRSSIIKDGPLHKDNLEISVLVDKELKEVTSKGGEAPLLYIPDNTCTESYVISGNYSIDDNTVKLSIYLTKGLEDKIIYQFNEITKLNEKETIGINVVKKIKDYLSKNKPE